MLKNGDGNAEWSLSAMGQSFRAKGLVPILLGSLLLVIAILIYFVVGLVQRVEDNKLESVSGEHMKAREQQQKLSTDEHKAIMDVAESIKGDHSRIDDAIKGVNESIEAQNYIIMADEKERERIKRKYAMPKRLKEKIGD